MESMPYQEHPAITKISQYAFQGCQAIGTIDIGGVITTIEEQAFYGAWAGYVSISNTVETIGARAFEFTIPDGYDISFVETYFSHTATNWTLTKDGADTITLTADYVDPDTGECWLDPYDEEVPDTSYWDKYNYLVDKYKDYTWTKTGS